MPGYISITDNEWCENQRRANPDYAVFWRKRLAFRAIKPGETFYFLKRSPINGERCLVGKATYVNSCEKEFEDAWNAYGSKLGVSSREAFEQKVNSIYKERDVKLGCIILNNLIFLEKAIPLSKCGIDFSPYIVSGKTIDEQSCKKVDTIFAEEAEERGQKQ